MRIVGYTLWLPKEGNSIDEYEDAAFPMDTVDLETRSFKCAVADGATETSFSGLWAQLLVSGYVDGTPTEALQERWRSSLDGKILPWYAEEKAQSGAFAALVGLTIEDGDGSAGRTWEAEAIGDSCLVQVRDKKILAAFPLSKSEQFNSSPLLISSNPAANKAVAAGVERLQGHWLAGDVFYLLTDAIARWTLKRQEEYGDAAGWLKSMSGQNVLSAFASVQRHIIDIDSKPLLRNDDVTLMCVEVGN